MEPMLQQYDIVRSELVPWLSGPLSHVNLESVLGRVRDTAKSVAARLSSHVAENLVADARACILPRDFGGTVLTPLVVVESLAVSVLVDEYFMTVVSYPGLKHRLWRELEEDGLGYPIWSGVEKALRDLC